MLENLKVKMNEDIKSKLVEAIKLNGPEYLHLHGPLNEEVIYQTIYDRYFKNITIDDIRELVDISSPDTSNYHLSSRTLKASFNLKLITHFTIEDTMNLLDQEIGL